MSWLAWILLGLVAGLLAELVIPAPGGIIAATVFGMLGALVGGWLGTRLGLGTIKKFDLRAVGLAVLGAIVVIALTRLLFRMP